jgi:hypothetical protein
MRKFIIKIIILLLIIVAIDQIIGYAFSYAFDQIKIGGRGRDNHICNVTEDDILVFGSSRAVHHYNTAILEDSTKMTCYNCGDNGCGIILSYGRLLMVKERYQPKLIIQDVNPDYDLLKGDNSKHLGWLKSRYEREGIKEIFDTVGSNEHIKMHCQMYRYNSTFLQNLVTYLFSIGNSAGIKGYRPMDVEFDSMKVIKHPNIDEEKIEIDPIKLKYVEKFIKECEGTNVVFIASPIWYGMNPQKLAPIKNLCQKYNVPFIDFSDNSKYVHCNKYFTDGVHLNMRGADEFTKDLIQELRKHNLIAE